MGTVQGALKSKTDCACGRRMPISKPMCYACKKGWPKPGEVRRCARCKIGMRNCKEAIKCRRCWQIERWQRGVFANARTGMEWTPAEDAALLASAGRIAPSEIGKQIGRSIPAVHKRAQILGVYLTTLDWTARRVSMLFGAGERTVAYRWISTGMLKASKTAARQSKRNGEYRIKEQDLERFILDCPWAYDPAVMKPETHRLAQLAKRVYRRDPWLTTTEVAGRLGVSSSSVWAWYVKGVIPAKERWVGRAGRYVVSESSLPAVVEAVEARRAKARGAAKQSVLRARAA